MNNLEQTKLSICISDTSIEEEGYTNTEYKFFNELNSAIGILNEAGFDDIESTLGLREPREDKDITTSIEISPSHLFVNTVYYDEDGDLAGEEEGGYNVLDLDEQTLVFNEIKALFDPTPQPILASVWDQVGTIRISQDEVIFEIGLPDFEEDE